MDEEEEILVQQHGDGTAFRWRILQMAWKPKDDQKYHKKLLFFFLFLILFRGAAFLQLPLWVLRMKILSWSQEIENSHCHIATLKHDLGDCTAYAYILRSQDKKYILLILYKYRYIINIGKYWYPCFLFYIFSICLWLAKSVNRIVLWLKLPMNSSGVEKPGDFDSCRCCWYLQNEWIRSCFESIESSLA